MYSIIIKERLNTSDMVNIVTWLQSGKYHVKLLVTHQNAAVAQYCNIKLFFFCVTTIMCS